MPDLLLELLSEEIPARMQRRAAEDLQKLVTDALVEAGLVYEGAKAFATPRRLALTVHGLPARSPERREERKGPRVGAPEKAIDGFLKASGLTSIDQAKVQQDKKGDFYVAESVKPGRPAEELIAEIVPKVVRGFPWPKSMRWGAASAKPGSLTWVRPLHAILCTFGPETEDPEIVRFDIDGIRSGDTTHGHRFMAPGKIVVRRFDDYAPKLERAHVVLDADRRKNIILHGARDLALAHRLELVEDEGLLEEVAGLVEWPVVLAGSFDESFLEIPPEVIRTTIRVNQKCFVMRKGEALSNRFILVANIEASDGGKAIVAGNERVIRARLADARHFWQTDLRDLPDLGQLRDAAGDLSLDLTKPLDQRAAKLAASNVVFHEKLGTQGERVERIVRLAGEIADTLSRQPNFFAGKQLAADDLQREHEAYRKKVERAASLAKADLVSEMVGEFPELQGLMGKYYALALRQREDPSVARAIEDHYKPVGPSDRAPADPVAIAVALADKLDTLVGFWAIDEKPTGSKDPYALRRAALGVIRILLENGMRLRLTESMADTLAWRIQGGGTLIERALKAESPYSVRERVTKVLSAFPLLGFYLFHGGLEQAWLDIILDEVESRHESEGVDLTELSSSTLVSLADIIFDDNNSAEWPASSAEEAKTKLEEMISRVRSLAEFSRLAPEDQRLGWVGQYLVETVRSKSVPSITSLFVPLFAYGVAADLLGFFGERLKVYLRDQGERHDLIDAAFSRRGEVDLLLIVRRVEALGKFLDTDDGKSLLVGYRRAANILREEEKKSKEQYVGDIDAALLTEPEEKALAAAIDFAIPEATRAVEAEDFAAAMSALAKLRAPVDAFFDKVLVNAPDPRDRANRLRLLNKIREATLAVADFSKVEG